MKTVAIALVTAGALHSAASAQPATEFRFENGTNEVTAAPGSSVLVSVYVTGLPALGTSMLWTTPPGTGQHAYYGGFKGSFFNVRAASLGSVAWSNLTIPPGMGFLPPPTGSAGHQSMNDVVGIAIGVWYNAPVTRQEFLLWQGTATVGASDVFMATDTVAPLPGLPAYRGFWVGLAGIHELQVDHVLPMNEGFGVIHVPAPGALALLPLAGLFTTRRRRTLASCH